MIKAYIVELADYNGKWVTLPMEEDDLQNEIRSLGNIGGDFDTHDHETDVEGISDLLARMTVFQMNELAATLDGFSSWKLEEFEILVSALGDLEESLQRLEDSDYIILRDIYDHEDLGLAIIEEGIFGIEIPDALANYIDHEAIGRDLCFENWTIVHEKQAAISL